MFSNNIKILFCIFLLSMNAMAFAEEVANKPNINDLSASQIVKHGNNIDSEVAHRIVEYRDQYGEFSRLDELLLIKGISFKHITTNQDAFVFEKTRDKNR